MKKQAKSERPLFIRNFPLDLRKQIKSAAGAQDIQLREFIINALREAVEKK